MAETSFGELEKPISANGGYNEDKFQGLLMNKIGRMNERRRVEFYGISGPGHYDLESARAHNARMAEHGLPLPHPHLPPLAPRSQALYGVDYFHAELARRRPPPAPPPASAATAALTSSAASSSDAPLLLAPACDRRQAWRSLLPPTAAPPAPGGGKGNLPGIVDGMVTFNMGVTAQVACGPSTTSPTTRSLGSPRESSPSTMNRGTSPGRWSHLTFSMARLSCGRALVVHVCSTPSLAEKVTPTASSLVLSLGMFTEDHWRAPA